MVLCYFVCSCGWRMLNVVSGCLGSEDKALQITTPAMWTQAMIQHSLSNPTEVGCIISSGTHPCQFHPWISTSPSKARICISGCKRNGNFKVQTTSNDSFPGLSTGNRIRWYGQFYRDGKKPLASQSCLKWNWCLLFSRLLTDSQPSLHCTWQSALSKD